MHIESKDRVDRPADEVYPLVRDHLPNLLPYLPDVEEVTELSRDRESSTRLRVVNRWRAKAAIPSVAAKFLPADLFTWTDRALWKDDERCVDYRLEGFGYDVTGTNYFEAQGDATIIRVTAEITIHPEKFKVPRLLYNTVFPLIEGSVKKAIQPNLTALARGLRQYFAEKR